MAISSSGVVYVTDYGNHRVQLFSADGQFISSFGSDGSQHGQLYFPTSICVDSTNGDLIKFFGIQGSGEGELNGPKGVAVDNTTGALYVCDFWNIVLLCINVFLTIFEHFCLVKIFVH